MNFSEQAMRILMKSRAAGHAFRIPSANVTELARDFGGSVDQLMLALIPLARRATLPQLSRFEVGAVAKGTSGVLYFGANLELDSSSLAHTIHAEQAAVTRAIMSGEVGIEQLAVSAPPCGHCRQFLYELASAERLQILLNDKPPIRLVELLPCAFGPGDLGLRGGLSGCECHTLDLVMPQSSPLADAACSAARASYAPYTGALAGAALSFSDPELSGSEQMTLVAGAYLENAAFNPSLSPLQTSLIMLLTASRSPCSVVHAVLVQLHDSKIDHADAARVLLRRVAPQVTLQVFTARLS